MKKEIKANHRFEKIEVSRDEALELGKQGRLAALGERPEPSRYKLDIIENIPSDEKISLYQERRFHRSLRRAARDAHGKRRRVQAHQCGERVLQGRRSRIRSSSAFTAPRSKPRRNSTTTSRCSRKRRSATTASSAAKWNCSSSTNCRPGLPMFLPRGAVIAEELEKLAKETEFAAGYQRVRTPHIARESLYQKSGHLPSTPSRCFRRCELEA